MTRAADTILEELVEIAREHHQQDAKEQIWEAYCAGTLTVEETQELEQKAVQTAEGRMYLEAYRPMSPSAQVKIRQAVGAVLRPTPHLQIKETHKPIRREFEKKPTEKPMHSGFLHRWRQWFGVGGGLCLAAALILWSVLPGNSLQIPQYTQQFSGGVATMRSGKLTPRGIPKLSVGSQFQLLLRPAQAVEAKLVARGWWLSGNQLMSWPVEAEVSTAGSVRVSGVVQQSSDAGAIGAQRLVVVIGTPGKLPSSEQLRAILRTHPKNKKLQLEGDGGQWRMFAQPVEIQPAH